MAHSYLAICGRTHLLERQVAPDAAQAIAIEVADIFGARETDKSRNALYIKQLAFISPEERTAALSLAERVAAGKKVDMEAEAKNVLRTADTAVDIAMFGRMGDAGRELFRLIDLRRDGILGVQDANDQSPIKGHRS